MTDYPSKLTLEIQPPDEKNSFQVLLLRGDMDKAGLTQVKDELEKVADNFPYQCFVLDFSALNYINSESIGFIMALHSHLVKMKKTLVLVSATENVKDILSVIGILSVIEYHDSLDDFKQKFV